MIAQNRKALHEYNVLDRIEAGLVLTGTEVKSIRAGRFNFQDGYAQIKEGEVFLHKVHIPPYSHGNRENHDPVRRRKLLLHYREIVRLNQKIKERGLTLVPLAVYLKRGLVKLELGLCKGKSLYDKRASLERKEKNRDIERSARED